MVFTCCYKHASLCTSFVRLVLRFQPKKKDWPFYSSYIEGLAVLYIIHWAWWMETSSKCYALYHFKVENFLKGSLDLILSPSSSVKIQIMGRKFCLRCKGKTFLGIVKKFVDVPRQCFANNTSIKLSRQ